MLRVVASDLAHAELLEAARWWTVHRSAEQAERWYDGFSKAIAGLASTASKQPLASEHGIWPFEVRQFMVWDAIPHTAPCSRSART